MKYYRVFSRLKVGLKSAAETRVARKKYQILSRFGSLLSPSRIVHLGTDERYAREGIELSRMGRPGRACVTMLQALHALIEAHGLADCTATTPRS
jgi:hypothetical protein